MFTGIVTAIGTISEVKGGGDLRAHLRLWR